MKAKKNQSEVCCFCGTMFELWEDRTNATQSYFCRHECGYDFACESLDNNHDEFLDEARVIAREWYKSPKNPRNSGK